MQHVVCQQGLHIWPIGTILSRHCASRSKRIAHKGPRSREALYSLVSSLRDLCSTFGSMLPLCNTILPVDIGGQNWSV
jgi:hypothetical protein